MWILRNTDQFDILIEIQVDKDPTNIDTDPAGNEKKIWIRLAKYPDTGKLEKYLDPTKIGFARLIGIQI